MLIKIAKLYTATLEATQTQDRIDTALSYIEDSQSELSLLLDHYEDVVRECFEQLGGREAMQPADQERETMYSLAETVNSELDECVKGLGAMIDEINASAKGGGGGDLLGEVVKVLNEQLVSLGWIDEVSSKVEERVGKMEREARELSEGFTG
jgi:nuclear pore complex protein Nup62